MKIFNNKFYKNKTGFRIICSFLVLLLIPVIICSVFSYVLNRYYLRSYESSLISSSSSDMNYFLKNTEEKLYNIYAEANLIFDENYLESIDEDFDARSQTAFNVNAERYLTNNTFLDSVIIASVSKRLVFSSRGIYDADNFFNNIYIYNDYDFDYLCKAKPLANSRVLLAPTKVTSTAFHEEYSVIPMIFSPVSTNADKIIIFNIGAQKLFDDFSSFHFTDNNIHYMLKNNSNEFISNSTLPLVLPEDEKDNNSNRYYYTANTKLNDEEYLVICSKKNFSLLGYTYAIAIPHSDIKAQSRHVYMTTILILFAMIVFLLLFAIYASTKFSFPWSNIAKTLNFNGNNGLSANETITKISHSITDLVENNDNLSSRISTILPLSQQRYITEILNSSASHVDDETYHMIFEKDYFSAIAIKIFSRSDELEITSQLNNSINTAIESMFIDKFTVFRLPSVDNTLYLLLNVDKDCTNESVENVVEQIKDLFKADEEILNIYIGRGNIQKDIDGLRFTHQQALASLMEAINDDRIQINNSPSLNEYSMIDNNENTLFNYIMANYTDKANTFIEQIFQTNKDKSVEYKKMLYVRIFNTLTRVLNIKGITHPDFSPESSDEFLKVLLSKSDDSIVEYFKNLVDACNNKKLPSLKLDITNVIKYIQDNYKKDISLEYIAEYNHVSVPYMSKRLKQSLNMSFKEYLTSLRIDGAKKLLCENSELSIQDIAESSGFYSNSAFTRTFKKSTGLSPREYRTLYKK